MMSYITRIIFLLLNFIPAILLTESLKILLVIKKNLFKKIILFITCFFLVYMVIFIGDLVNLPPTIFCFLFCVYFCFEGSTLQKLTIGLMFASTAFSFNAIHDNFIWSPGVIYIRLIFWSLFYLFFKFNAPDKDYELSPSLWKLLLILTLTPLGIVLSIVLLSVTLLYDTKTETVTNLALLIIALFSFIGLLRTITVLSRYQKLTQQTALMNFNQKYYETMERQHFEIRRLKHDLANHLQTLYSLPADKQTDYLKELIENKAVTTVLSYSGDSTVNAVLSVKENLIKQNNIEFNIKANIPNELSFEKVDICALFANALDNAIEACLKLPLEKRKISLETSSKKGLFVLHVKNTSPPVNAYSAPLPKTTKSDTPNHGYGLKSINEIVKRYNGNLEINVENEIFSIFLYIPFN